MAGEMAEIGRLWEDNRQLRKKIETSWDLALGQIGKTATTSMFLDLPGLRGFWPMSSVDSSGNAYDLSGQGRTLTYNGNPTYNFSGLVPYVGLDGTGDYLSRADEVGLDILGTESYVASAVRGLTIGGWFLVDNFPGGSAYSFLIGKWLGGSETYLLTLFGTDTIFFFVRNTGLGSNIGVSTTGVVSSWYFLVGRYIPSTEISIFKNGAETVNSVDVPASLPNTAANFVIGSQSGGGGNYLNGRASLCFLCASALSDEMIGALYQRSRALFRV